MQANQKTNRNATGNPFQPAATVQRYLKMLVYGASGSGKTWLGLSGPRPCAILDLEGGSAYYGNHPVIGGFDRISTKDLRQIEQAIQYCRGGAYATLVVDPITVIWSLLQDAALVIAQRRGGKDELETGLTPKDWGAIKRKYSSLMTELVNLPCHVILIAREKELVKIDRSGNMEVIGAKGDTEKNTTYYPDVVLRLMMRGKKRVGLVEKDRSSTFQVGQEVEDPALSMWLTQATPQGHTEPLEREDEVDTANASVLEEPAPAPKPQPVPAKKNGNGNGVDWQRIHGAAARYGLSHEDLQRLYRVTSLKDLSPDELAQIPADLDAMARDDEGKGWPATFSQIREDLEGVETSAELEERTAKWRASMQGISRLGLYQARIAKEKAMAALEPPADPAGQATEEALRAVEQGQ